MKRAIIFTLILASAPASAQSGCVRDASGALNCTGTRYSDPRVALGATRMPRQVITPQVLDRANDQMQSVLDNHEDQRRQSDVLATHRRLTGCVGALVAAGTARARAERTCDR
jgi:hypothetical protein